MTEKITIPRKISELSTTDINKMKHNVKIIDFLVRIQYGILAVQYDRPNVESAAMFFILQNHSVLRLLAAGDK